MERDALEALYNQLVDLVNEGKEKDANALILKRFPELPQQLQGEILLRMSTRALNDEADRLEGVAQLQAEGEVIVQALDIVRQSLAK